MARPLPADRINRTRRFEGELDVVTTDINMADWIELIQAQNHEMPGRRRTSRLSDRDWLEDPTVFEELVAILQVEHLKSARLHAYRPHN